MGTCQNPLYKEETKFFPIINPMQLFLYLLGLFLVNSVPVEERSLISFSETDQRWMTETEILTMFQQEPHKKFIDLTDHQDIIPHESLSTPIYPDTAKQNILVKSLFSAIDLNYIQSFLNEFTSFKNRYYKSSYGLQSAEYLYNELEKIRLANNRKDVRVQVSKFEHKFSQFSIIARLESTENAAGDIVILGAHQDSINKFNPEDGFAPGVDDDATGVVNNLHVLQLLLAEPSFVPYRPIEFHFYAGEERGLLGSQDIAKAYSSSKDVYGMLQTDMSGYVNSNVMAIFQDNSDPGLIKVLTILANEYTDLEIVKSSCGYGCSDHASWKRYGFPSCLHGETTFRDTNPNIHTAEDTFKFISLNHVKEFVKNSLGFAIELSLYK
jgi:leucyl aminopeptidase